jgi:hypothetical protein
MGIGQSHLDGCGLKKFAFPIGTYIQLTIPGDPYSEYLITYGIPTNGVVEYSKLGYLKVTSSNFNIDIF